jgi:hypothetical protein
MAAMDDIKGLEPGSRTERATDDDEKPAAPPAPSRSVGPESEVRGGPEAPSDN